MQSTKPKVRKFTIQLTVQEAEVISAYLINPENQKPWSDMARKFQKRADKWRSILKKEVGQ